MMSRVRQHRARSTFGALIAVTAVLSLSSCVPGGGSGDEGIDFTNVRMYPGGPGGSISCPAGQTAHMYFESNIIGHKRFAYRGAGEVHNVFTYEPAGLDALGNPTGGPGYLGLPHLIDTRYRALDYYQFNNYGNTVHNITPTVLTGSNTLIYCD